MSRTKATSAQLNHLVEFMKVNYDCASGRANDLQGKVELERQWQQLTDALNALGGPVKTVDKWKQTWRDLRNAFKKKALKNKKDLKGACPGGTSNGPEHPETFSSQDEAVLSVMEPVTVYCLEGVCCTMDVDDASGSKVVPQSPPLIECVTPLGAGVCVTSSDLEPTQIPAPPIEGRPSLAKAPPRSKMRSRCHIAAPETFDSLILKFEKRRLAVQKKEIEIKEKKLQLEERRLLIEEAKVKAFERIASALENIIK